MDKIGAYILDEKGNLMPDMNDPAMAQRYKQGLLKEQQEQKETIKKRREVKENAIDE